MEETRPHYFWNRIWAQFVDTTIVIVILWLLGLWNAEYDLVPWYRVYLETFVEISILALLLVKYGQTPGKYLLGLKVRDLDSNRPGWLRALKRQTFFAFIPLFIGELSRFVHIADPFEVDPLTPTSLSSIVLMVVAIALMVVFYFGSFLRWTGQAYWDRFAGTYVDKA